MRMTRYLAYAAAIGFFLVMQSLNVARQARFERLSGYSRAVVEFLGMRVSREQYLLFYYENRPIGYSGYTVASLEAGDRATYKMTLDGYAQLLPWLGSQSALTLQGDVFLDGLGEILSLDVTLAVAGEDFRLSGERTGGDVVVSVARGGQDLGLAITLPRSVGIAGAVMPIPPLGELKEGETREIPYFDPLTRTEGLCTVRVNSRSMRIIEGVRIEVFDLDVTANSGVFKVTAGQDGEILKVAAPGGIELRRSSALGAHRIFKTKDLKGTE